MTATTLTDERLSQIGGIAPPNGDLDAWFASQPEAADMARELLALRAALAASHQPAGEPVAFMTQAGFDAWLRGTNPEKHALLRHNGEGRVPLYASPVPSPVAPEWQATFMDVDGRTVISGIYDMAGNPLRLQGGQTAAEAIKRSLAPVAQPPAQEAVEVVRKKVHALHELWATKRDIAPTEREREAAQVAVLCTAAVLKLFPATDDQPNAAGAGQ